MFGGVGAVIGGTTGKKSQKEMIKKMYIKITLNHTYDTYTEISLISADTKKGSFLYNTMTDCANKILALLDSITAESSAPSFSGSAADEITDDILINHIQPFHAVAIVIISIALDFLVVIHHCKD